MLGTTISHYRILEKLGEGGMGAVYRARDTSLDRDVALKVLPPEVATDPGRLSRLRREAKALAKLDHPNIVTVHSIEDAGGVHLITMGLVKGKTLADLIPKGGMTLKRIFEIAVPLADALATAHEKGVIHRDLKPGNIMVTEEGRVKVLDFGLAKLRPKSAEEMTALATEPLTREGAILGTAPYMSPEQLEGREIDTRSDIFSLGVILHEMATGRRPFGGDSRAALISSILTETPPDVDAVRVDLPHHLGRIIRRCMEKPLKKRFQSARDVHSELADLEAEVTAAERPPPSLVSSPSPRWKWIGLGGAAVLLVWALGAWLWEARAPSERTVLPPVEDKAGSERKMIIVLPFENLGPPEDSFFAAGMTEEIASRLASVHQLGVISRTSAVQYDITGKTLKEVGRDFGVDYVLEGTVRWGRPADGPSSVRVTTRLVEVAADIDAWNGRYDESLDDIFAVQAEIAKRVIEKLEVTLLEPERGRLEDRPTDNLEAYQAYLRGMENISRPGGPVDQEWRLATKMFQRAIELDPGFALAHAGLSLARSGEVWVSSGREQGLDDAQRGAFRAAETALELEPDLPESHAAMGRFYYWVEGDYDRALEHLAVAARGLPRDSEIVIAVAGIHRRRGDWEEGLAGFRRAAVIDPRSSTVALAIAQALTHMRRYEEADGEYARSLSIGPDQSVAYFYRAENEIHRTGDLGASRAILEQAPVEIPIWSDYRWYRQLWLERDYEGLLQRLAGSRLEDQAVHAYLYGLLWEAAAHDGLGDLDRARAAYEAARIEMEKEVEKFPEDANPRIALAEAYAGLGRKTDALREAERGLELSPVSKDAMSTAEQNVAHVYLMISESGAALDLLERRLSVPSLVSVEWLRLDPVWDPIRSDPRFLALLAKYEGG